MRKLLAGLLTALLLTALTTCDSSTGSAPTGTQATGTVTISIGGGTARAVPDASLAMEYRFSATCPTVNNGAPETLTLSGASSSGSMTLAPGDWTFAVEARLASDTTVIVGTGTTVPSPVTVRAGATTNAGVLMTFTNT